MEQKTDRVVAIRPPTQGTTPGLNITRIATSVTAVALDLTIGGTSKRFFGKRLRVVNEDASIAIWIAFSNDGTPDIAMATAGGATLAAGTVQANGFKLPAGTALEVRLTEGLHKYIHIQAASGTPVLTIYPASAGVGGA